MHGSLSFVCVCVCMCVCVCEWEADVISNAAANAATDAAGSQTFRVLGSRRG